MDAIFVGNGSLLIQCAESFRLAGGSVLGVITSDGQISSWAKSEGIPALGTPERPDVHGAFDYMFSVANLTVLPDSLISKARVMAINFHDGPLPDRAGSNVPAWAILEGAQSHAVTWHAMTDRVDGGGTLAVRPVVIRDGDSAFSLNAACYEAGLAAFRDLIDDIKSGGLRTISDEGMRNWYAKAKRPDALGTLDFVRDGAELDRLVRALDFGGYSNPLALPKLWTGKMLVTVGKLQRVEGPTAPARQIVAFNQGALSVAVADGVVRLSGLTDLAGRPVESTALGLQPGDMLPEIPRETIAPQEIGRDEPAWEAELLRAVRALPPYPLTTRNDTSDTAPLVAQLPGAAVLTGADALAAAFLAWTAGLGSADWQTIALVVAAGVPWLSDLRPVGIGIGRDATARSVTTDFATSRATAMAYAPMAADLALRIPDTEARQTALRALDVVFAPVAQTDADALGHADLALACMPPRFIARADRFDQATLDAMASAFAAFLCAFLESPDRRLSDLPLGPSQPLAGPDVAPGPHSTIQAAISESARHNPDAPALEAGEVRLSRGELDARAEALAGALRQRGAAPGKIVGICLERTADLVIAMLAILKTGAAYLPLDPSYPVERLDYMVADAGAPFVVTSPQLAASRTFDPDRTILADAIGPIAPMAGGAEDLAYLIYTSGSTGRPKGVMIPHAAVLNFFAGMDLVMPLAPEARLLSVTSVSFDISVLEILWTLSRGATLVLQTDGAGETTLPDFSLFYFASEASGTGHHAYRLLLEGARFADANGFEAIWTPERHFHAFGGLYPNPAISSAAIAGITKNVKLRAGSAVVPLHHPVRVAEDWALVDNLSNGRAGVAIAAGWQPNDFVVRTDAFYDRKSIMLDTVETLRKLWKGERLSFPGPDGAAVDIEIHPKPMQDEIPLWLTAAGNPETFAAAARLRCGVLTHLLGQTFDEVDEKIRAYRMAWRKAGHPGAGHVVLMLHSFVGEDDDTVRNVARDPMKGYLKSAVDLVRRAAWTFPTIINRADSAGMTPQEMFEKEALSAEDLDQLLNHAFERYYRTSGLFGTPETAKEIVRKVASIGVDEIACLIDFGIDTDLVLKNLPHIKTLMDGLKADGGVIRKASVAEDIARLAITHLQCTPSMAAFLAADTPGRMALGRLDGLMVGGEAFPPDLARDLRAAMSGALFNMYGPTETTIWSSVARLDEVVDRVPLGLPIANTTLSVRSADGRAQPALVEGELWIGGAGLAKGYWNRPDLTAEKFVTTAEGRFYRTGDLVRCTAEGTLDFLGRIDNQVKIRGNRIELGEIEAALAARPGVAAAVVRPVTFGPGDTRLIGYVTAARNAPRPDPAMLRLDLAEALPEIMVPTQVILLDRMPMTPNGKIDRKALPDPVTLTEAAESAEIPAAGADHEAEAIIGGIWGAALGLKTVPPTANFFDLGGHSLLVVQVQRQMRAALGRDIAITDLFRFPTVRSITAHLAEATSDDPADDAQSTAASRGAARAAARLTRMGRR